MTTAELIERLKEVDPEGTKKVEMLLEGEWGPITEVYGLEDDTVYLEYR